MTRAPGESAGCTAGAPSPYPLERLSAFLDGDLPAAELQVVRQHVDGCAACAGHVAELGALAGAARGLEAPEPPPTLWPAIAGELDRRPWSSWSFWRPFAAGTLAGAAAVAAVALASRHAARQSPAAPVVAAVVEDALGSAARRPSDPLLAEAEAEFASAAAVYERSIEKLRGLLAREEGRWPAEVRARYAERLARLDEVIVRSREVARRAAPGDSAGNEQLFAAYQQKITFLAETVHRGGGWGRGEP